MFEVIFVFMTLVGAFLLWLGYKKDQDAPWQPEWKWDEEAKAGYLYLTPFIKGEVVKTHKAVFEAEGNPGTFINVDKNNKGEVVGVEVLVL